MTKIINYPRTINLSDGRFFYQTGRGGRHRRPNAEDFSLSDDGLTGLPLRHRNARRWRMAGAR